MKADVLRLLPAFALIVALAAGLLWFRERPTPAPDFTLEVVAGEGLGDRVSLEALRGKVVVLEFWASWCTACRRSVPALNALQEEIPEVQIYGITSEGLTPAQLQEAYAQFGFDFPSLRDDQGLSQAFNVEDLPTLVVIDQDGQVSHHHIGTIRASEIVDLVRPLGPESTDVGDDS